MDLITLRSNKLECTFSPIGAALTELKFQTRSGTFRQVALSPLAHRAGTNEPSLAGRTIGPCCGRVRDARITLNGRTYALDANENSNHLHGGFRGTANRRWEVIEADDSRVAFALSLPDGEGGYPGNRAMRATYILEESALRVEYTAVSDASTWLCLTNHTYWDLTGRFDGSAMGQILEILAGRAVFNDANHLPVSIEAVDGTPFDFRVPASPAAMLERFSGHPQLSIARGFNNALLVDAGAPFAARLIAPDGSLTMTMTSDYPALVFYSGGFLGKDTMLPHGPAVPGAALALEAQTLPDPFHLAGAAPEILLPGERWQRYIQWTFE